MNKIFKATLAAAVGLSIAGSASATGYECVPTPESDWKPEDEVRRSLTDLGYEVRKIKISNHCYEAYAVLDGQKFEVFVQPDTGEIAHIWED